MTKNERILKTEINSIIVMLSYDLGSSEMDLVDNIVKNYEEIIKSLRLKK